VKPETPPRRRRGAASMGPVVVHGVRLTCHFSGHLVKCICDGIELECRVRAWGSVTCFGLSCIALGRWHDVASMGG
jgi:hypothetical protein